MYNLGPNCLATFLGSNDIFLRYLDPYGELQIMENMCSPNHNDRSSVQPLKSPCRETLLFSIYTYIPHCGNLFKFLKSPYSPQFPFNFPCSFPFDPPLLGLYMPKPYYTPKTLECKHCCQEAVSYERASVPLTCLGYRF